MSQESTFNREDAETIYEALAEGNSLLSICEAMGISYSTARRWEFDHPEHAAKSTRARELGCHYLAEECLRIADTPQLGEERTIKPDGLVEKKEADMLAHRRLQIETRMRLIGKWAPKIYGERTTLAGDPDAPLDPRPLANVPTADLVAALERLGVKP